MVAETAAALLPLLTRSRRARHLEDAVDHYAGRAQQLDDLAEQDDGRGRSIRSTWPALLDELAADDAVFLPGRRHPGDLGGPVPAHDGARGG